MSRVQTQSPVPIDPRFADALIEAASGGDTLRILRETADQVRDLVGLQTFRIVSSEITHARSVRVDPVLLRRLEKTYLDAAYNPIVSKVPYVRRSRLHRVKTIGAIETFLESPIYTHYVLPAGADESGLMTLAGQSASYMVAVGYRRGCDWPSSHDLSKTQAILKSMILSIDAGISNTARTMGHDEDVMAPLLMDFSCRPIALRESQRRYMLANHTVRLRNGVIEAPGFMESQFRSAFENARFGRSTSYTVLTPEQEIQTIQMAPGPDLAICKTLVLRVRRFGFPTWSESSLRVAYGLTRREADVVLALCKGLTTGCLAKHLRLTPDSVRTYLKRAYAKTQTSSQSQLVSLILSGRRGADGSTTDECGSRYCSRLPSCSEGRREH